MCPSGDHAGESDEPGVAHLPLAPPVAVDDVHAPAAHEEHPRLRDAVHAGDPLLDLIRNAVHGQPPVRGTARRWKREVRYLHDLSRLSHHVPRHVRRWPSRSPAPPPPRRVISRADSSRSGPAIAASPTAAVPGRPITFDAIAVVEVARDDRPECCRPTHPRTGEHHHAGLRARLIREPDAHARASCPAPRTRMGRGEQRERGARARATARSESEFESSINGPPWGRS